MSTGTGVCVITIMEESVHTFQAFKKINLGFNNKKLMCVFLCVFLCFLVCFLVFSVFSSFV